MTTPTVTQQINQAIADAGGSTRDALNNALSSRDAAVTLLQAEGGKVIALMMALEAIRTVADAYYTPTPSPPVRAIDRIARDALRVAGGGGKACSMTDRGED